MRTRIIRLLVLGLCSILCVSAAKAQSFAATHAQVSLITEDNLFKAGSSSWIGLRFVMEKGWHIYWVNPGDAGGPPSILWQLPAGFHAGAISWPVPERLTTGSIIDYGYQGQVLLPVPVQASALYAAGTPVKLSADVRYLICSEVCVPAKAHIELTVPQPETSATASAARRKLFQDARNRLPKKLPAGMKVTVTDDGKNFQLTAETGGRETSAVFFPLVQDQIENAAPQAATPSAKGIRISLKKSVELTKPLAVLKGVLVLGSERAYEISAPVTSSR